MKRTILIVAIIAAAVGGWSYYTYSGRGPASGASPTGQGPGGGAPGAGGAAAFGRAGMRLPMTVELTPTKRVDISQRISVVGNLVGAATVETVPKISGRLASVSVRLGDRVSRGQQLAKIEDSEILEQVKQAEASLAVGAATIRQREADLKFSQTNLDRSRNLFERQLIPRQTLDDAEARHQASVAQLDLAQAQNQQSQARIEELKITLSHTVLTSPVDGFVGNRTLDPGAWVTPNSSFLSLVDIRVVRIIANVVERDLRRMTEGLRADVEVDAYPGEKFTGTVAHVAPVLDPATRTAQIEIRQFRLKPGMYAKVNFEVDQRQKALVVPTSAVVDVRGSRGVFLPEEGDVARFKPVTFGMTDHDHVEVVEGLTEGEQVITTGAAALRDGDRIVLAGAEGQGGNGRSRNERAQEGRGRSGRAGG
jgi:HlyD family secretion protein